MALAAALVVAAVVAILLALFATAPSVSQVQVQSPLVGHPAPTMAGTTLDGKQFSLGDLTGHFVLVDFVASWCTACRQEQPELEAFSARHAVSPNGARLVAVVFGDSASDMRGFLGSHIGEYPVITDLGGQIALRYGVSAPPEKYLIRPDGLIVAKINGPITASGLERLLQRAGQTTS